MVKKVNKKLPKTKKLVVSKPKKKEVTKLPKTKKPTALTSAKQTELKKLITAYQQVGISLTKLLKPTK